MDGFVTEFANNFARYCPRAHIVLHYGKRHKTGLPGAQSIAQIC